MFNARGHRPLTPSPNTRVMEATTKDPAFLRDIQKLTLDLDPLPDEDLQKIVASGERLSPALVGRARDLANVQ